MGLKLKKIDRVPTSLKELIDVDSSTGITRCVDCISNGMVLVANVPRDISKKDTFVFKNLTDIIKVGQGMQASLVNGVMTISSSLESLNLNDLLDVSITNPSPDDVLTYNSILQRWENTAGAWVPASRTITINGVIQDLSADRTWTISTGGSGSGTVTDVTGTGTVSGLTLSGTGTTSVTLTLGGTLALTSGQITAGLGFTPYNATNPNNYISQATANGLYYPLSSNPSGFVTSAALSSYLTIAAAASTYQPIFVTENGLTYASGYLKLGGDLTGATTITGHTYTHSLSLIDLYAFDVYARQKALFTANDGTINSYFELYPQANYTKWGYDDGGGNLTEIEMIGSNMYVRTPAYSSASIGDVLTLLDNATGEVEFQTPTGGSGGGDMYKSVYDIDNDGVVDKAETVQIVVRNSTGATLTKGQVVYLSGATGNRPNALLADASTEATSSKTIGLVSANIANNTDGYVTVSGSMHDLDLGTFADGDRLWLSTTPGQMVANTPPAEPNHAVFIGTVARAHPTLGRIVLAIQNGYELNELHGVQVPSPSNNDVLRYNSTSGLWEDDSIPTILGYTPVNPTRSISTTSPLTGGGDLSANRTLSIPAATGSVDGYLTSSDWTTFNGKANLASPAFTGTPTAPTAPSGINTTQIATTAFVQTAVQQSSSLVGVFGDGGSGNATITGSISLTNDAYYNDLTISGAGSIFLNGFRLFVSGILDISNAGALAIHNNGFAGDDSVSVGAGANTGGGTLGRGGYGQTTSGWYSGGTGSGVVYRGGNGGAGASANTNNAQAGSQSLTSTQAVAGGTGGSGGKGGNSAVGSGALGGAGQTTSVSPAVVYIRTFVNDLTRISVNRQSTAATTVTTIAAAGGYHGGGGGGAASSTVAVAGGGGAGGGGGGNTIVYARQIVVGAGTNAEAIAARGGRGGSVTYSPPANVAGGGGAGGGGGGYIYLVYGTITGGSYTFASANGGAGGNGGNGNGTGLGGQGGAGGSGGRITAISLGANTITVVDGTANLGATPAIPTTTTGSAGGAGGTCTFSS